MKNFKGILVILSLFIPLSCGDDDDGGTLKPNELTYTNLAGTYS
jgi:hypothetical protein